MLAIALSAVRAYRASLLGSLVVTVLATALLTATYAWTGAGIGLSTGAAGAAGSPGDSTLLAVASSFAGTTVLVVIVIVASVFGQALRQRAGEFALLRVVGATPTQVHRMITAEIVLVTVVAAPIGIVAGLLIAPQIAGFLATAGVLPAEYSLAVSPFAPIGAVLTLLPTVLVAARLVGRGITRPSVIESTRSAAVESSSPGIARIVIAAVLAVGGVAAALTPLVAGGSAGTTAAASSALMLIVAAALAGPLLVGAASRRLVSVVGDRGGAALGLATRNTRGFSKRLTGAVVPMALLVALGLAQVGSGTTVSEAAGRQLTSATHADLVASLPRAAADSAVTETSALPGVTAVSTTSVVTASIRTDADDPTGIAVLDDLSWETTALRVIPDHSLLVPHVVDGSLSALSGRDVVAVSDDVALRPRLGGTVDIRQADGTVTSATIGAIYDNGLGLGDYLVGPDFAGATPATTVEVLVAVDPDGQEAVRRHLTQLGAEVVTADESVRAASGGSGQELSLWALAVLLGFVALAGANTLVMLTAGRAKEFALLRRTGATRRQVVGMVAIESGFVAGAAIVIGLLSVLPSLAGMSWAMLGTLSLAGAVPAFGLLAAVVVVLAATTMIPAVVRATR
ncbi:FtsX-like permease family protein [Frigoribacterium sp. 2-23]|uniref:FtsX-like permease family protein n=1 Tax=Frigoribacterium sp. 2-23 TaxID=3415006 RepID=UPI003C7000D0